MVSQYVTLNDYYELPEILTYGRRTVYTCSLYRDLLYDAGNFGKI
jgi:hypothetical protein